MTNEILFDLRETRALLEQLNTTQFNQKLELLSGSSIGMHVRHITEYYQTVLACQESICYDKRARNKQLEQNIQFALATLDRIINQLKRRSPNRTISLIFNTPLNNKTVTIDSTVYRELYYCFEHSTHHKALIKIALKALNIDNLISNNFGVAPATIKFNISKALNTEIAAA